MNSHAEQSNLTTFTSRSSTLPSPTTITTTTAAAAAAAVTATIIPTKSTIIEPPQCWCNRPTVKRRVKKQSENFGRYFWKCARFGSDEHDQRCEYFRWLSEGDLTTGQLPGGNPPQNSILFDGKNHATPHTVSERAAGKMAAHQHIPNSTMNTITQFLPPINRNDLMTSTTKLPSTVDSTSVKNQNHNENISTPSQSNRHVRFAEQSKLTDNSRPIIVSDDMDTRVESNSGDFMTVPTSPSSKSLSLKRDLETRRYKTPRQRSHLSPLSSSSSSSSSSLTPKSQNQLSYQYKYYQNPNPNTIPRFTTPELLNILEQHFDRQDYMCDSQERSSRIANIDLEHARKQLETLTYEMQLLKRENDILMREKALLKRELDEMNEELRENKRRRTNTRGEDEELEEEDDEEAIEVV
ncbi:hypothetical protein G9A89_006485 [Geosiphon pyriformis]|nr:hypothetical protein G9A89_006485 [Geosiphon pyriformis]